jgi:hypothetical protein
LVLGIENCDGLILGPKGPVSQLSSGFYPHQGDTIRLKIDLGVMLVFAIGGASILEKDG